MKSKLVFWSRALLSLVSSFLISACATTHATDPTSLDRNSTTSEDAFDYKSIVSSWTRKEQSYDNFAASFQVTAVLLSKELVEAQVKLDAQRFSWSQNETQEAKQKALYDVQSQTTVLISLYTDKDEDNNLEKSKPSWNLYLDVNGRHLAPQSVTRIYENRVSLLQKYPSVNVWSRNYYAKFAIPTDEASSSGAIVTLAGPLGNAHLKFK